MRAEERIARLEAENARLREQISQLLGYVAENAALREQVSQLLLQLAELKGRLAKDSHNSSKPPSRTAPDASLGASSSAARSRRVGKLDTLVTP